MKSIILVTGAGTGIGRLSAQALAEAGHGKRWAYAYTDSLDDLPLLRGAETPVIVKGGKAAERRLFRAGLVNGRVAVW